MTYESREISNADGQPVVLYEFRLGATYWRYCTADREIEAGLDENNVVAVWEPKAILDEGISQGGNDQNDLQVNVQSDAEVAHLFRNGRPSGKLWLTVFRYHYGDPTDQVAVQWVGSVTNAILGDLATSLLNCRSIAGSYDRNGLRLFWGRMCPHVLYGIGCYLDKADFAYPHVIATKTGNGFTLTAYAAPAEGTFAGGFLEYARPDGSIERLAISSHDGNDFLTLGAAAGLEVGLAVTLYPGCDRTTATCKLFANLPNYGGFPHLPGQSPFGGAAVF